MGVSGSGESCGGDVAVGGDAEADGLGAPGGGQAGLGELVVGGGEADLESFGFAVPALAFSLGDAGQQVAANVFQPRPPGEVDPEERTPEAPLTELQGNVPVQRPV